MEHYDARAVAHAAANRSIIPTNRSRQRGRSIRTFRLALLSCLLMLFPPMSFGESEQDDSTGMPGTPPGFDVDAFRAVDRSNRPPRPPRPPRAPRDKKFHLYEATIADIHRALERKEISCDQLIRLYFKRIKAYSGHCVKYDTNGDGIGPDYDFFMPSGRACISASSARFPMRER
jgi:hypothetical protein